MATDALEAAFERAMREGIPELKTLGYNPTYFVRMMNERGAAQAIRDLIDSPNQSEGFVRLWEMKRLDLSAEAIVADDPRWSALFTDDQRAKARHRLEQVDYVFRTTGQSGTDWTEAECAAAVNVYFQMLSNELLGRPSNKAEHNRLLRQTIRRSAGSIEFKHANISAVLVEMQQPYIEGYKPRGNFQGRLADAVETFLDQHPDFFMTPQMLAAIEPTEPPPLLDPNVNIFDEPPDVIFPAQNSTPWLSRRGRRINFAERDARNRQLGRFGEQFVIDVERQALVRMGRSDLADRVDWISDRCGDGVGFDILSFNPENEMEKWIEVKTTALGKYHPFLVTANEVRCSEAAPDHFQLFRVFDFRLSPRVFVLPGPLSARCELRPSVYVAAPKGPTVGPTSPDLR